MLASKRVISAHNSSYGRPTLGVRAAEWLQSASGEVWVKFLLSLVGLGLAFAAALLSTASGEAGHLWASVILASLALLTSAAVGLFAVPYLARRVALERLRQSFHYEVTKAGVVYVLVTLVIGIAALNTGNNLLYIVVSAMLAAILVSGVVSALVLRGLELEVQLAEHVFANRQVEGWIAVRNARRYLPAFSIRVVAASEQRFRKSSKVRKQWRWERTTFAFPAGRAPERQWIRVRDWRVCRFDVMPPPPGIFEGMVYFPFLPAGMELSADLQLLFARRGRYRESSFGIATRFPFAFLTKTRVIALARELLVYPPILPPDDLFEILPQVRGDWETFVRGQGSDLYRIREYTPEDSGRHVDWKATAKSGSLKVREFTREDQRKVCIAFDNPAAGTISEPAYERAINLAASVASYFSSEEAEVSYLVSGQTRGSDLHQFLAALAVIEAGAESKAAYNLDSESTSPVAGLQEDDLSRQIAEGSSGGEFIVILTTRPRSSFPAVFWNRSHFIFLGEPKAKDAAIPDTSSAKKSY